MAAFYTLQFGMPIASLDALAGTTATNGTEFALPGRAASSITWQSSFSSAPSAVNVVLQLSNDGSTWFTIDTSTTTAGEIRTINTSARFARARLVSKTGGGTTTVLLNVQQLNVGIVSGSIFDFILDALISDGTNGQVLTTDGAGGLSFENAGGGGGGTWGSITGTLSAQLDLQAALDAKVDSPITDADVPDNITINGTNNVTWASVNKTGSSLADLATRGIANLQASTSADLFGVLSDETGTGVAVFNTSPNLLTPTIGGLLNLVTTSTDGLYARNTTAATVGVPVQISPRNRISGTGWDLDDAVSRTVSFFTEVLPVSGNTVSGFWNLGYINPVSAAITYPFILDTTGNGLVTFTTDLVVRGAGYIGFSARGAIGSPANGQFNFTNAAFSTGVGFDVDDTDAVLKIRTRAQTGYATVDALAYQVSGVAGAAGGTFTTITSITVVNGIITAISGT